MPVRVLRGGRGDLYDANSENSHMALNELWGVLHSIGFKLVKKADNESTLRVYPTKIRQYPLLNPRFEPASARSDGVARVECLDITTLSRGDERLDRLLRSFRPSGGIEFVPFGQERGQYFVHGDFILPTRFVSAGGGVAIDFASLRAPLHDLLEFLRGHR